MLKKERNHKKKIEDMKADNEKKVKEYEKKLKNSMF